MLIGTYNVHYGVGADARYDVGRIADLMAAADIACLQEVVRGWPQNGYADQTAEIGRRLNRYYRFHGPMEADASTVEADGRIVSRRRSFGNAIVSRWPIVWSRGVMLPKTRLPSTFDLQRGYIEAVVAAPSGALRVYCTHLSHVGVPQRLPQVEALMRAVGGAATTGATWDATALPGFVFEEPAPEVPASAIVAGDFNFTPSGPEYALVCGPAGRGGCVPTASPLADAWTAAGNSADGIETCPGDGRIDHVFMTRDLVPTVRKAWIDDRVPASDHWPVFVELDL